MKKPVLLAISGVLSVAAVIGGVLVWRQTQDTGGTDKKAPGGLMAKVAAPDFTMADREGNNVSLSALRGNYVVLFFSGGLSCFTCLSQIGELNKDPRLSNDGAVAFSVIPNPPSDWQKAKEASSSLAQARPLFDTDGKVFKDYESLNISSLMGQGLHMAHTYVIVNKEGMIVTVLDDAAMGVRNDILVSLLDKLSEIESGEQ